MKNLERPKRWILWLVGLGMLGFALADRARAQEAVEPVAPRPEMHARQDILIPDSSLERAADKGKGTVAHTNHVIMGVTVAAEEVARRADEREAAATSTVFYETPATIRSAYNLPLTGGAGVIAVVDAYDDPAAESDLEAFSSLLRLPACSSLTGCFQKVYASGRKPALNCGWAQEEALDIEWAHAMAPNARIVLVEAASNSSTDLFHAVDVANGVVSPRGMGFGEVTMSWGLSEFPSEAAYDTHFVTTGIVYFASSGDVGGARNYPAVSPRVVAAGGTTIHRSSTGAFLSETAWSGSGGGPSPYEPRPPFQNVVVTRVGAQRGSPDVAFDADPHSGVLVYDSTPCGGISGWLIFGGTSVSAPSVAGIVNLAGHFYHSSSIELSTMYSNLGTPNFRDIVSGTAGSFSASPGWDFTTGIGSSLGVAGK
ncbi:MAG TPA: S53 family peptidase [Terriglobia bacterium]|nr:S53 family peptidase [Terriglobia bacterium]